MTDPSINILAQSAVLEAVRAGTRKSECWVDGRDFARLIQFFPTSDWDAFGFAPTDQTPADRAPRPWETREIVGQIVSDARFGLEKAEDERGISAGMMAGVLTMWSWIVSDPDLDGSGVDGYGAYFFRHALQKYEAILAGLST